MKVLALGDVVSDFGCDFVRMKLPKLKREYNIDFCLINGENSAVGNGITPESADFLISCGVDLITTGNHCFRRKEIYDYFDEHDYILRPCNFPSQAPGRGYTVYDMGRYQIAVINLMGTMYMQALDNPFKVADKVLEELNGCRFIIVDFHAEATSEKQAMGYYLAGRVSAVFGTHTHVQTADEKIINGTGYITDLGMCGSADSILGVRKNIIVDKFLTQMPSKFETEDSGSRMINGCVFELDDKTGKCISIQRININ